MNGILVGLISVPLGLLYANAFEWAAHRYLLHGLGRNKKSVWAFHWHDHHRNARRENIFDVEYTLPLFRWHAPAKEIVALGVAAIFHLPLFYYAPIFAITIFYGAFNYYFTHKKAHLDPEWARKHVPWHYDHHLGPDQDQNWCVTKPWFDILMGTRVPYIGTELEQRDSKRKQSPRKRLGATVTA